MTWSIKNVTCLSQPVSAIYKVKSGRYYGHWISAMAQRVDSSCNAGDTGNSGQEYPLVKEMTNRSSVLAWRIP